MAPPHSLKTPDPRQGRQVPQSHPSPSSCSISGCVRLPLHRRQQPHPSISGQSVFNCTPRIFLNAFRPLNSNVNREYIYAITRQWMYRRYFFDGRPAISVGVYFVYFEYLPEKTARNTSSRSLRVTTFSHQAISRLFHAGRYNIQQKKNQAPA
jgi:hypothetical protein